MGLLGFYLGVYKFLGCSLSLSFFKRMLSLGDIVSQYLSHGIWKYCRYCEADNVNTVTICITVSRNTAFDDESIS